MALAERLKNREISRGASETESGAFWERLKERPKQWGEFLHEVRVEMRQVTWPTQHEVVVTTFVVIVAVAFFGLFFFGVDNTVLWVTTHIFNLFKH
jgi:preprotein translocase SecE subunit